jgi:hypothetical protein
MIMTTETLELVVRSAGVAHFAVVAASLGVPSALGWRDDVAKLKPINRQIFYTYAGYILTINLLFGLVATFGAPWLIDRTPLAACVTGFIAAYWGVRVALQFVYYDRKSTPKGLKYTLGEIVFVTLFAVLTVVFSYVTWFNLTGTA